MNPRLLAAALGVLLPLATAVAQDIAWHPVPEGARPHDVAPAPDGTVWYTDARPGSGFGSRAPGVRSRHFSASALMTISGPIPAGSPRVTPTSGRALRAMAVTPDFL